MKRILFALLALVTLAFASCGKEENSTNNQPVIPPANSIDSYLGKWNLVSAVDFTVSHALLGEIFSSTVNTPSELEVVAGDGEDMVVGYITQRGITDTVSGMVAEDGLHISGHNYYFSYDTINVRMAVRHNVIAPGEGGALRWDSFINGSTSMSYQGIPISVNISGTMHNTAQRK